MKTYSHLYEKIVDIDNIKLAVTRAAEHKRTRRDVARVLANPDKYALRIQQMLLSETYEPRHKDSCTITEGSRHKERVILKPSYYCDQIIHHAIIQVLAPIFMRPMYEYSIGSIPERGNTFGRYQVEKWLRDKKNTKYCGKCDIRHFYESVDKEILKARLTRLFRDEKLLRLLFKIIDSSPKGLPLGFYTSPWFANFLLTPLDHLIKEQDGVRYFIRNMDDMVFFGPNKKKLHRALFRVQSWLRSELKLNLKGDWQVFLFDDGNGKGRELDFLGYQFYRDRVIMRKSVMLNLTRQAALIGEKREAKEAIGAKQAASFLSRLGGRKHSDTYQMYLDRIKPLVNVKQLKKIVSKDAKRRNTRNENRFSERGRLPAGATG